MNPASFRHSIIIVNTWFNKLIKKACLAAGRKVRGEDRRLKD